MIEDAKTARRFRAEPKAKPIRRRFGVVRRAALLNVQLQCACTQAGACATACGTDPRQAEHANVLARAFRARSDTPDSPQNTKEGSLRTAPDPRVRRLSSDILVDSRMAGAFFETNRRSLLTFRGTDRAVATGGSTSGCVRATVADDPSCGYRVIVPEECVADKHESPHFANLCDMAVKCADVLPVAEVQAAIPRMEG